jgi:hypothetical protein
MSNSLEQQDRIAERAAHLSRPRANPDAPDIFLDRVVELRTHARHEQESKIHLERLCLRTAPHENLRAADPRRRQDLPVSFYGQTHRLTWKRD